MTVGRIAKLTDVIEELCEELGLDFEVVKALEPIPNKWIEVEPEKHLDS